MTNTEHGSSSGRAVLISPENFPDSIFRQFIDSMFDTEQQGWLSIEALRKVTVMNVSELPISSLKGIEYFSSLTVLGCVNCGLRTLDISRLPALEVLVCDKNRIKSLNTKGNKNLRTLSCAQNAFKSLSVRNQQKLTSLDCSSNQLRRLKVSNCLELTQLNCANNHIEQLDVQSCSKLFSLDCSFNAICSLNLTGLKNLQELHCDEDQLEELLADGCPLKLQNRSELKAIYVARRKSRKNHINKDISKP